jgi:DNA polymerase III epsilon subunit-like protein
VIELAPMVRKLIFLDTETTGIDLLVDRLVQVAYKTHDSDVVSQYFRPPVPISVKSMSISHITNKDVADKDEFSNSQMKKDLLDLLKDNILVAHNAGFDVDMLFKEGIPIPQFIDTLKIVKYLDKDNEIPEYGLQYLRYFLDFEVEATAHDAVGDVLVLEKLFQYLFERMKKLVGSDEEAIEKMVDISCKPLLLNLFNYGKHKGKKIEEVLAYDRNYLEWMLEQKLNSEYFDEDWIFTLKHHLKVE